jgi:hypothetical protein
MPNPNVNQGTLNRLIASVTSANFPALNVTPSFLHREGIRLAFEGQATTIIDTMTGTVISPEPYQRTTATLHLLKSQSLSQQWEAQRQLNSAIGPLVIRPDSTQLSPYDMINCGIINVAELTFNGQDAAYTVSIQGYISLNSSLWG